MKKSALLLIFTCCLFLNATAQGENVYYLKNNGLFVSQVDNADYIRIVKFNENGSRL